MKKAILILSCLLLCSCFNHDESDYLQTISHVSPDGTVLHGYHSPQIKGNVKAEVRKIDRALRKSDQKILVSIKETATLDAEGIRALCHSPSIIGVFVGCENEHLLKHIENVNALEQIYISGEECTDIPKLLANKEPVKKIYALGCDGAKGLKGNLHEIVRVFPDLAWINLEATDIEDDDLLTLSGLKKLHTVSLNDTKVTKKGLDILKEIPSLQHVMVHRCPDGPFEGDYHFKIHQ